MRTVNGEGVKLGHSFSANRQSNSAEGEEKVWTEGGEKEQEGGVCFYLDTLPNRLVNLNTHRWCSQLPEKHTKAWEMTGVNDE